MTYADIILPLPLDSLFTYSVPDVMAGRVIQGVRVLVPFGKSKTYVGLVVRTHGNKPKFKVKDISTVMDEAPVVNSVQLELWRWMADYYLSSVGDVMNAALPGGLKSEDGYTARTETYVSLAPEYQSEQAIHVALDMLRRAAGQRKVFETFLALSHWDAISGNTCAGQVAEVSRDELMNESHCSAAVFRSMVVRKIFNTYEREVGRLNNGGEPHPELIKPLNEAQQTAYNNIVFSFLKKCGAAPRRYVERQDRDIHSSYTPGHRAPAAGSLSAARDSAHGADTPAPSARVRQPPRHIPLKVF